MSNEALADAVFWFHMFWIGLLFASIPVCLIWPSTQLIQFGLAFSTLAAQILWGGCPLTTLEMYFRDERWTASFTVRVLRSWGIEVHPAFITWTLVALVIVTFAIIL